MVNANLMTFIWCAAGGFIGALVGTSFSKTISLPSEVVPAKPVVARDGTLQCPPPPACLPQPDCPTCDAAESGTSAAASDDSADKEPSGAAITQGEAGEGKIVVHSPAPAPKDSYNVKNFYPLHSDHNRFEYWYNRHKSGKGVWKWTQYFPAWERHLAKFIAKSWTGQEVHMAELGIFSGGSLEMWQNVFGPGLRLWGCDIAKLTKQYEEDDKSGRTKIFNMDQTDPNGWAEFKKLVPKLDILIDDGLHLFSGQKATFDNILDHIAPGGVFMTEDISDGKRPGAKAAESDGESYKEKYLDYSFEKTRGIHYEKSLTQDTIDSIHYYPYLFVVEKREQYLAPHGKGTALTAKKHGTLWKPITRGVVQGEHAER